MSPINVDLQQNEQQLTAEETGNYLNPSHRIIALDVLRGIAILFALFVSIWIFGGFSQNQQLGVLSRTQGFNYGLYSAVTILLEGKMKALIAIVFGASMLLYLFKDKERKVLTGADFFIRRQLWLIAFGLINAFVFLSTGDLLFHLGIMGILLFAFLRLSAKGFMIAAMITTLVFCGKNYWRYADDHKVHNKYLAVLDAEKKIRKDSITYAQLAASNKQARLDTTNKQKTDTLTKKQVEEKQAWEGLVKNKKYDPKKDEEQNKAKRTVSYGKIWNHQMQATQSREASWTYTTGVWDLSSMMFLGMALFSFGFFNRALSAKKYAMIALLCLLSGLLLAWSRLHFAQITIRDYEKYITRFALPHDILFPLEQGLIATGYISIVLLLLNVRFLKRAWKALAITGQMALTNYLMQSIFCVLFFSGFGLGYYAMLNQWQLYVFAAEVILVNVAFSFFWLKFFHYGPAEWLWRCLVYKKWLYNRKGHPAIKPASIVS